MKENLEMISEGDCKISNSSENIEFNPLMERKGCRYGCAGLFIVGLATIGYVIYQLATYGGQSWHPHMMLR
jgi:hypothetical protein